MAALKNSYGGIEFAISILNEMGHLLHPESDEYKIIECLLRSLDECSFGYTPQSPLLNSKTDKVLNSSGTKLVVSMLHYVPTIFQFARYLEQIEFQHPEMLDETMESVLQYLISSLSASAVFVQTVDRTMTSCTLPETEGNRRTIWSPIRSQKNRATYNRSTNSKQVRSALAALCPKSPISKEDFLRITTNAFGCINRPYEFGKICETPFRCGEIGGSLPLQRSLALLTGDKYRNESSVLLHYSTFKSIASLYYKSTTNRRSMRYLQKFIELSLGKSQLKRIEEKTRYTPQSHNNQLNSFLLTSRLSPENALKMLQARVNRNRAASRNQRLRVGDPMASCSSSEGGNLRPCYREPNQMEVWNNERQALPWESCSGERCSLVSNEEMQSPGEGPKLSLGWNSGERLFQQFRNSRGTNQQQVGTRPNFLKEGQSDDPLNLSQVNIDALFGILPNNMQESNGNGLPPNNNMNLYK